ncbi:MAG: zinc-ribbon domain-containing protein [Methanomassiliicoccales archaeon]|nr:zinc-ribbon domain-containing protein [Methanomassiliicoccales archaeon]
MWLPLQLLFNNLFKLLRAIDSSMVYCPKCSKQNADDARYCSNCGASLITGKTDTQREWDNRCNEGCSGRGGPGRWFWGLILVLVGIWVILEIGIRSIPNLPAWFTDFQWTWIFGVVIGVAILVLGISVLVRAGKHQ